MALRSVIDIDVNDDRFKQFLELYEKYAEALKQMPADWAKVGTATSGVVIDFASMTAALLAQQDLIRRVEREQQNLNRTSGRTVGTFRDISKAAKDVYQSVADTTRHLLRWTGITGLFGGLLGAGGLYGLDRLTESASGLRTQSLGLGGVDPNTLLAQNINWGQFFDVRGVLGNIANLQGSLSGQVPFINLGIPGAWNAGATGALPQLVQRIHDLYRQTAPGMRQMMPWFGAAQQAGFTPEAIRAIGTMTQTELNQHLAASRSTSAGLGVDDKTLKDAQDFQIQLERVTTTLQYKFLAALDKSGVLDAFTSAAQRFVDWIGTGDAKKDIELFTDDIHKIVMGLEHLTGFMTAHPAIFGAITGAIGGLTTAGPVGAAVGAAVGAGVGLYAGQTDKDTAMAEAYRQWSTSIHGEQTYADFAAKFEKDWAASHPHFQHGGIVPIAAHAGEMVLPQPISEGFQGFFSVGGAQQLRQLVGKVTELVQLLLNKVTGVGSLDSMTDLFGFAPAGGSIPSGPSPQSSNTPFASSIVDMAKRIAGLGVDPMTAAGMAMESYSESGFRDKWNFMNPQGDPNSKFSASGFWQVLKSNWQKYAPQVGVTTPQAIGSSFEDQVKVVAKMVHDLHWQPWSKAAGGSGGPDPAMQSKIAGIIVPTANWRVTVDNRTGGSITSDQAGLNVKN